MFASQNPAKFNTYGEIEMIKNLWHQTHRFSWMAFLALTCVASSWASVSATDPYHRYGSYGHSSYSQNYSHSSKYHQPSYSGRNYHASGYRSAGNHHPQWGGQAHSSGYYGHGKSSSCNDHSGGYKSSHSYRVPHATYPSKQKYSRGY